MKIRTNHVYFVAVVDRLHDLAENSSSISLLELSVCDNKVHDLCGAVKSVIRWVIGQHDPVEVSTPNCAAVGKITAVLRYN